MLAVIAMTLPASADTRTKTGSINGADPQMGVVTIDGMETCGTQQATLVRYQIFPFTPVADGSHRFILQSDPLNFASLYLYEGSFDPDNGATNCVAGDNATDNPANTKKIVEYDVTDGTHYFVVVFDDNVAATGGDFTLVIDALVGRVQGPGKRFVRMPDRINCDGARATARWKLPADRVDSAVFKANNGKILADVTRIVPGRNVVFRAIPPNVTHLAGVLRLQSGKRVQVGRDYVRC
jgi:hypothetical protein